MSTISTHILDTALGQPARDVRVALEQRDGDSFRLLAEATTNADGRIAEWPSAAEFAPGEYRLIFAVAAYFGQAGREIFYPSVTVEFRIGETQSHYHVPLLLAPFGYSTYRGS